MAILFSATGEVKARVVVFSPMYLTMHSTGTVMLLGSGKTSK